MIEQRITDLQRRVTEGQDAAREVERLQSTCHHAWSEPKYDPIITMGGNWRGSQYVPPSHTARWTRTCSTCGRVEHTQRSNERVTKTPQF